MATGMASLSVALVFALVVACSANNPLDGYKAVNVNPKQFAIRWDFYRLAKLPGNSGITCLDAEYKEGTAKGTLRVIHKFKRNGKAEEATGDLKWTTGLNTGDPNTVVGEGEINYTQDPVKGRKAKIPYFFKILEFVPGKYAVMVGYRQGTPLAAYVFIHPAPVQKEVVKEIETAIKKFKLQGVLVAPPPCKK